MVEDIGVANQPAAAPVALLAVTWSVVPPLASRRCFSLPLVPLSAMLSNTPVAALTSSLSRRLSALVVALAALPMSTVQAAVALVVRSTTTRVITMAFDSGFCQATTPPAASEVARATLAHLTATGAVSELSMSLTCSATGLFFSGFAIGILLNVYLGEEKPDISAGSPQWN